MGCLGECRCLVEYLDFTYLLGSVNLVDVKNEFVLAFIFNSVSPDFPAQGISAESPVGCPYLQP